MEKVVLKATKRDVAGKQVNALRRSGKLPAVIYGKHTEPINISLDAHSASLALAKLTSSSIVTVDVDGKEYPTLVREKQRDFIKNRLLHVDFLAVSLTERIRAEVALRFTGVSAAVKDFNAILVHNLEQFHVECLPTDLPEYIEIDISRLARPGDGLRVRDIAVAEKVEGILKEFNIHYTTAIISAHRNPNKIKKFVRSSEEEGYSLIVAIAGLAAHLPGVVASMTVLPVIGVPVQTGPLNGMDALYSIVQMPSGVPVASVGIGNASNAALLAVEMLGIANPNLRVKMREFRKRFGDDES